MPEIYEDTDVFGVTNPENYETGYVCISGNAGQVFGINIYLSPKDITG
jgi:hypothetical protein